MALLTGVFAGAGSTAAVAGGTSAELTYQTSVGATCCVLQDVRMTLDAGSDTWSVGVPASLMGERGAWDPAWSQDGRQLAFASVGRAGAFDLFDLLAGTGSHGTRIVQLTTTTGRDTNPAWAPGDQRIYFISNRTGSFDLWQMDADGSGQSDLTNDPANDCGCGAPYGTFSTPAVSPNGSVVAYSSDRTGTLDIWLWPTAGGAPAELLPPSTAARSDADFSPDGKHIAFQQQDPTTGDWQIDVVRANGAGPVAQLTTAGSNAEPAWSPDGQWIAFDSDRSGTEQVWVMRADGSDQQPVADGYRADWRPATA